MQIHNLLTPADGARGAHVTGGDRTWRPLGASCIAIGVTATAISSRYPYGSVTAMGPGFVPTAVALLLIAFGGLILLRRGSDIPEEEGASSGGEGDAPTAPAFEPEGPWRAMLAIGAAIGLFGFCIGSLGLPLTVFLTVLVAGFASQEARLAPLILVALLMAAGATLVFGLALGLSFKLLPRFS